MSSELVKAIERFRTLEAKYSKQIQEYDVDMSRGNNVDWNRQEIEEVKKSSHAATIHLAKLMHTDLGFLLDRIIEHT